MDVCFRVLGRGRQNLHAAVREADLECSRTAPDDCDLHHAVVSTVVTAAVPALVLHVTVAELVKRILKGNRRARACAAADIFIHAVILLCALVPRKILLHAARTQLVKHRLVAEIQLDRFRNRQIQILRLIIREGKAVAHAVKILVGAHGVLEPARFVDDWNRSVAHRHHLRKSARLKPRRHQVHIRAGKDRARHRLIVVAGEAELSGPLLTRPVEILDIFLVALTKDDELHAHIHQLRQNLANQLNALLLDQTRDARQQRPLALLIESKQALNLPLAARLARHILDGKMVRDERVMRRIVMIRVDAVQDAVQLGVDDIDHALQAMREIRIVKLARIGRRYGRHRIRHQHRALHQVDILPPFKLIAQTAVIPAIRKGKGRFHFASPKLPLIGDIVNRVNGFDMRKRIVQNGVIFQIEDGKRGFPVIAVQNIGQVAEFRQQVDDRAAEEGKAQGIIPVTIEPRTVEQMLVADGIDRHTVQLALVQSAGELTLSQMDNAGFNQ